jgi:hypothetical protein
LIEQGSVAFVLNIPSNSTAGQLLNIFISPVAYFRGDQLSAEIGSVIGNASKNLDLLKSTERQHLIGSIFGMLVAGTVCLKHEGFHEEREWRVVYNPKRMPSPLMTSNIETIDGIPQIVYKIPISGGPPSELDEISIGNMLDRILIGPSPYPWAMYEAFATALSDAWALRIRAAKCSCQVFRSARKWSSGR